MLSASTLNWVCA